MRATFLFISTLTFGAVSQHAPNEWYNLAMGVAFGALIYILWDRWFLEKEDLIRWLKDTYHIQMCMGGKPIIQWERVEDAQGKE